MTVHLIQRPVVQLYAKAADKQQATPKPPMTHLELDVPVFQIVLGMLLGVGGCSRSLVRHLGAYAGDSRERFDRRGPDKDHSSGKKERDGGGS